MLDSTDQKENLLEVSNIEVVYNHVILVLRGVSLNVLKGGITTILGGNGAGKSTTLLQAAHNYEERGMRVLLFTPQIDDRAGVGNISSRLGLTREAFSFDAEFDLFVQIRDEQKKSQVACVFIDEAQFLTSKQVLQQTIQNHLTQTI